MVRRSERGWVVGEEEVTDLTSAMVLADLLAADLASVGSSPPPAAPGAGRAAAVATSTPARRPPAADASDEAARLTVAVTQLEHALAARVRVEQAIGVLAERHRMRARQAFELLRGAARSRGRRVVDIAEDVVNSTSNPLLLLPAELARKPEPPQPRVRSARRSQPVP